MKMLSNTRLKFISILDMEMGRSKKLHVKNWLNPVTLVPKGVGQKLAGDCLIKIFRGGDKWSPAN